MGWVKKMLMQFMNLKYLVLLLLLSTLHSRIVGQALPEKEEIEELRLSLNKNGSHYLKATFLNQVWLRYNESNPNSLALGGPSTSTFDIGLRRTRIQFFGQLTDHVFFYTQFGQNNFNYLAGQNSTNTGNRKVQAFFHDALGEYKVWKGNDKLFLGVGLTITNGLSRFSQPSVATIMTLDVPVFAQATVDQTDEFSRKLSMYARGQLGRLDYRLVVSDPFPVTSSGQPFSPLSSNATFSQVGHHKQYQGFLMWNFLDREPHTTPYMTGTYLGKKKIFNLEAGIITQSSATWSRETVASDTVYHAMNLMSAALFYDAPINTEKGTALSAYAGYFHYDFGKGYLRYNGVMNPANGSSDGSAITGSWGNAFPMVGTGNVIYAQLGYLFRKDFLGDENGQLMPYASLMSARYDRVSNNMNVVHIGVNWLLKGHSSKLTLDFQNRPVFELQSNELVKTGNKAQVVLQYQILI